jgi:glutaredoxin 3
MVRIADAGGEVITMYGTAWCPYCVRARRLLNERGVSYSDIRVEQQPELRQQMRTLSGRNTVPQIWIGDTHVGGFTDLLELELDGKLDNILQQSD